MGFNKILRIAEYPARADQSAVAAIHDSVGKFGIDKWTSPICYTQGKSVWPLGGSLPPL